MALTCAVTTLHPTTLTKIQYGETSIDVLNRAALVDPGSEGSLWVLDGNEYFYTRMSSTDFEQFLWDLRGISFSGEFASVTTTQRLSGQTVTEYRVDAETAFYLYPDLGYVELTMDAFSIFISAHSWIKRFGEPI